MKYVKVLGLVLIGVLSATQAFAVDFFTVPTVDAALLGAMVTSILAALALIWAARKGIKMINRS